ncbi:hypothetical protein AWB70_06278 [Caballeronia cordobensis]|uniref:Uncharacterized protein n=1 Tax=Caballeronia cordobensis TaxID=1353886 RepID=A0A158JD72_CABCO|nr:hypothetical protein AWB70_06278 [Caballeronia cordobensis]
MQRELTQIPFQSLTYRARVRCLVNTSTSYRIDAI